MFPACSAEGQECPSPAVPGGSAACPPALTLLGQQGLHRSQQKLWSNISALEEPFSVHALSAAALNLAALWGWRALEGVNKLCWWC